MILMVTRKYIFIVEQNVRHVTPISIHTPNRIHEDFKPSEEVNWRLDTRLPTPYTTYKS